MKIIFAAGTMILVFGLTGCQKHETAADSQADVAKVQADASKDVAAERKDADAKVAEAARDESSSQASLDHEVAKGNEGVAITAANGAYKVAMEKCEAMSGDAHALCKRQADADLDSAKARAHQGRAATDPKP